MARRSADDHTPRGTDWMLACDGCDQRYPAVERLRGTGAAGLAEARSLAAAEGWSSDAVDNQDWCPTCTDESESDR